MLTEKNTEKLYWSEVISPNAGKFHLPLKAIWRQRDLLILFVKRDIASQYRQTILGPLWHVLQPAITSFIFIVLFNRIARIPTDGMPAILFYLSGITIWNFFAGCFTSTAATFSSNASIFGKVYFPRLIIPLSVVASNIIRFSIQFALVLLVMLWLIITGQYSFHFGWHLLLLPVIILVMALFGLGGGILVSALTTKYRDMAILINFCMQLLMYVTPVAYSLSYLQQSQYASFIYYNPLSPLTEGFRFALLGTGIFTFPHFMYSIAVMCIVLLFGLFVFSRVEKTFMDTV